VARTNSVQFKGKAQMFAGLPGACHVDAVLEAVCDGSRYRLRVTAQLNVAEGGISHLVTDVTTRDEGDVLRFKRHLAPESRARCAANGSSPPVSPEHESGGLQSLPQRPLLLNKSSAEGLKPPSIISKEQLPRTSVGWPGRAWPAATPPRATDTQPAGRAVRKRDRSAEGPWSRP